MLFCEHGIGRAAHQKRTNGASRLVRRCVSVNGIEALHSESRYGMISPVEMVKAKTCT